MTDTSAPPRLAVLHTVVGLADFFRPLLAEHLPQVRAYHMADESLLQDMIASGETPRLRSRLAHHLATAEEAGAAGLFVTCSSITGVVAAVRPLASIPLFTIDDPMAAEAVQHGATIALICTTPSTVAPSTRQLERAAAAAGKTVVVLPTLVDQAFAALQEGDRDRHDKLVLEAALGQAKTADVIVLAQASLARLRDEIETRSGRKTVSSPVSSLRHIAAQLG